MASTFQNKAGRATTTTSMVELGCFRLTKIGGPERPQEKNGLYYSAELSLAVLRDWTTF